MAKVPTISGNNDLENGREDSCHDWKLYERRKMVSVLTKSGW